MLPDTVAVQLAVAHPAAPQLVRTGLAASAPRPGAIDESAPDGIADDRCRASSSGPCQDCTVSQYPHADMVPTFSPGRNR